MILSGCAEYGVRIASVTTLVFAIVVGVCYVRSGFADCVIYGILFFVYVCVG